MTEGGAVIRPGAEEIPVPYRPRNAYTGYKAFGSADGAVLVEPGVTHGLRKAAELATAERRFTGGLLYGRGWVDDQGAYVVVSGFIEAGPGENSGDRISASDPAGYQGDFTLSEAGLRLLREDAARMYPASMEAGWWRTLAALGEFGPGDFGTQAALVGPDGVGLLVYGSGIYWGSAYLGPDGHAPDSAGTLVAADGPPDEAARPAGDGIVTEEVAEAAPPVPDPGPEVIDLAAGESLLDDGPPPPPAELVPQDVPPESWVGPGGGVAADDLAATRPVTAAEAGPPAAAHTRPLESVPGATTVRPDEAAGARRTRRTRRSAPGPAATGRTRPSVTARVRVPPRARAWAARRPASPGPGESELPTDVLLVVFALVAVIFAVAIIVGVLVHSVLVAVIIGAIGLLAIFSTVWMSHR